MQETFRSGFQKPLCLRTALAVKHVRGINFQAPSWIIGQSSPQELLLALHFHVCCLDLSRKSLRTPNPTLYQATYHLSAQEMRGARGFLGLVRSDRALELMLLLWQTRGRPRPHPEESKRARQRLEMRQWQQQRGLSLEQAVRGQSVPSGRTLNVFTLKLNPNL